MYLLFFFFWVMLNVKLTLEIALFGIAISALMYVFICRFAGYSVQKDFMIVRKLPLIIQYCVVLFVEIVKANLVMVKYLLSPHIMAEPALIRFRTDLKTPTARVLLANSITLTPGTITVEMADGEYTVHCYDKSMGEGIEDSVFVRLLRRLEA